MPYCTGVKELKTDYLATKKCYDDRLMPGVCRGGRRVLCVVNDDGVMALATTSMLHGRHILHSLTRQFLTLPLRWPRQPLYNDVTPRLLFRLVALKRS